MQETILKIGRQYRSTLYTEHHSVCPFVGIGTPPTPLPQVSVPSPPPKGGGHTRLRLWGVGSPNSTDWRKSLALCLLCTAKTKCRNFETNIPRKGISGSQSQFPHSCVCERFIYSIPTISLPIRLEELCRPILGLYKSLTDT
jgi:hypothetical protein